MKNDDLKFHDDSGWEETPIPAPEFDFDRAIKRIHKQRFKRMVIRQAVFISLIAAVLLFCWAVSK